MLLNNYAGISAKAKFTSVVHVCSHHASQSEYPCSLHTLLEISLQYTCKLAEESVSLDHTK